MSLETAELAVAARAEVARAAWAGAFALKLQLSNRNLVDLSVQQDPYVCVEVAWLDGFQADLNPKPVIRSVGQIVISAMVKENAGFADGARLRDHFIPYFERKDTGLGPLRTRAAVPHKCFRKGVGKSSQ
jgi:hypothetical protein